MSDRSTRRRRRRTSVAASGAALLTFFSWSGHSFVAPRMRRTSRFSGTTAFPWKIIRSHTRLSATATLPLAAEEDEDPAAASSITTTAAATAAAAAAVAAERGTLDATIIRLALPAMCGALIDPLLSLVDSGFVGRLGSEALGALGPACEIFTFCFAMCWALRDATCSLTANFLARDDVENGETAGRDDAARLLRTSVSAGLVMSVAVAALLRRHSGLLLGVMGVDPSSPMMAPASLYLRTRALAFPAVVMLTVCEGGFRGSGDTRSPVLAGLVAGAINLVLDPFLMFNRGMGIKGAAAATAIAQYAAALFALKKLAPLLRLSSSSSSSSSPPPKKKNKKERKQVTETTEDDEDGEKLVVEVSSSSPLSVAAAVRQLVTAGGAMFVRTGSILTYWTIGTALATRLGTHAVAAHHVALQIWLFFVLPVEGPSVANQVLLPRALALAENHDKHPTTKRSNGNGNDNGKGSGSGSSKEQGGGGGGGGGGGDDGLDPARRLLSRVMRMAFTGGLGVAGLLLLAAPAYPSLFSLAPAVAEALRGVLPLAAGLLPLVASNMALESFLTGARCFQYLALSTIFSTAVASGLLVALANFYPAFSVTTIWCTICGFFALRSTVAGARVWTILRRKKPKAYQAGGFRFLEEAPPAAAREADFAVPAQ